jgi:hypothetical protein
MKQRPHHVFYRCDTETDARAWLRAIKKEAAITPTAGCDQDVRILVVVLGVCLFVCFLPVF